LQQLWRRIVFNVLISNTDDHLRNHGFLYPPTI
jgi:serine/threonine-protein kinase HipA